jgi:hypothetical protein
MRFKVLDFTTALHRFVKLEYIPTSSIEEATELLQASTGNEFIEGIMFGKNKTVIMHGNFANHPPPGAKVREDYEGIKFIPLKTHEAYIFEIPYSVSGEPHPEMVQALVLQARRELLDKVQTPC